MVELYVQLDEKFKRKNKNKNIVEEIYNNVIEYKIIHQNTK